MIKREGNPNWDKNIIIAYITKRSENCRLGECHIVESRDESRANLAHPNFFTFYTAIGVKGRLLSPLSLKCASNEHRGSVRDTQDYHYSSSNVGCKGTTQWLPGGGDTYQPHQSPKLLTPKTNKHQKQGEDLQGYPFLPLGETPINLKANLVHPNFTTFSHSFHRQRG